MVCDGRGGGKQGTDDDWPGRTGGNKGCCGSIPATRADWAINACVGAHADGKFWPFLACVGRSAHAAEQVNKK